MTETRFTAGPWHPGCIVRDGDGCKCRSILDQSYPGGIATVHLDNGVKMISEGGNCCPPLEECIANSHLISAAPELYEALEHCETVMMIVEPRSHKAEYLEALHKARAILAKARGTPCP